MDRLSRLPPIRRDFADIADACKPTLIQEDIQPRGVIKPVKDEGESMGWRAESVSAEAAGKVMKAGDEIVLDFGGHHVGFLSFDLVPYKYGLEPNDSPCRIYLVFGEILTDVAEELEDYGAWLSKAWLPDEMLTIDYLPKPVHIKRRHAFRYVRIKIVATSPAYGVKVENAVAHTVACIPSALPTLDVDRLPGSLSSERRQMFKRIDEASLRTLRNCMQTVYEDGPRRDQRLWIGDLRLQALCNYSTFSDFALAKRCLYLFAAAPVTSEGLLASCVYEYPTICSGGISIVDYAHLYSTTLYEYVAASGDLQTGKDLFDVAKMQFDISLKRLDAKTGIYRVPEATADEGKTTEDGEDRLEWHFIDWHPELDKNTAEHCILIYTLSSLLSLAKLLGIPTPSFTAPFSPSPVSLDVLIDKLRTDGRKTWSSGQSVFTSGPNQQISWASNAWAVISGLPTSPAQAADCLTKAYAHPKAITGMTPYLHHYLVEAFIVAGLTDLAMSHIEEYWGSMITAGAETFWEAWNPKEPRWSPYGDVKSNSFCHAWSCTPAWLLRKIMATQTKA